MESPAKRPANPPKHQGSTTPLGSSNSYFMANTKLATMNLKQPPVNLLRLLLSFPFGFLLKFPSFKAVVMAFLPLIPLIILTSFVQLSVASQLPRGLSWSSKTYGPDGPWHAVTVQIGSPPQSIDLFPGGFWQSNILSSSICASTPSQSCSASLAGLYNSSASTSSNDLGASFGGSVNNGTFSDKGLLSLVGSANITFDAMSIATEDPPSASVQYSNFDMLVISEGYEILPNGTDYPIEVGNLALGAPNLNQTWGDVNGTLVSSYLYTTDQVSSNSFGMHIGSTALGISPSLYIGGYDQTRVLGQVTVQDYNMHYFPIDLLDIGIGVAEGSPPSTLTTKSGLLASGNSSIGVSMEVIVEPISPFIYLPKSSCDAITANLPVTYRSDLGLYFWDTTSTAYHEIVSSPAFLSFTFRLNSSITQNMTINVPFSLLNLTLTSPLVSTPTQYFPCNSFDYGKSYGGYMLGKAFLQAAFLGVNWQLDGKGKWFLAQAPGPNTPSQAVAKAIGLNDAFITPTTNEWVDTWKGAWTPITDSTNSGSSTPSQSIAQNKKSGLSGGAIAGIAIGVVGAVSIALAIGIWVWRKQKTDRVSSEKAQLVEYHEPGEMDGRGRERLELAGKETPLTTERAELSGDTGQAELQA
ncbi:hypothetical protein LSUE1_G006095 [Lachnellula suecica]|uniref:Peptidase A1 domain-containing protein n=1 Tax=Lachnellula suecica TaxID=602035 RepID=A0A8T9C5T0_9HELO|nr:hypothetical protein LSUE1_G006095 [Lachnellula suecica]